MTRSVSAVIVNFNSDAYLRACLSSLREGLTGFEADVIVVDNASTDGSPEIAVHALPSVRIVRNPTNVGFATAVNQGVRETRGELILLVNPDATLEPDAVRQMSGELDRHPECALVGPMVLEANGTLQGSARGDPYMLTGLFGRATLLTRLLPGTRMARRNVRTDIEPSAGGVEVDWVSGACMLVRREALAAVGGFDERYFLYWEDADLCRRLRGRGYTVRYVPTARMIHQTGRSGQSVRPMAVRAFHRSAYLYYSTHVAPARLHPARAMAWALLRIRCAWKLAAAHFAAGRLNGRASRRMLF